MDGEDKMMWVEQEIKNIKITSFKKAGRKMQKIHYFYFV